MYETMFPTAFCVGDHNNKKRLVDFYAPVLIVFESWSGEHNLDQLIGSSCIAVLNLKLVS
jgi:hypothetical protein